MKVLVCGGRDYANIPALNKFLDEFHSLHSITLMITGTARGADRLADGWAVRNSVARVLFPANWEGEGRKAGCIRNQRMLDVAKPDTVIAFSGGRGTADTITRATLAGIKTIEVKRST